MKAWLKRTRKSGLGWCQMQRLTARRSVPGGGAGRRDRLRDGPRSRAYKDVLTACLVSPIPPAGHDGKNGHEANAQRFHANTSRESGKGFQVGPYNGDALRDGLEPVRDVGGRALDHASCSVANRNRQWTPYWYHHGAIPCEIHMATNLTMKNIPEEIYDRLKEAAKAHHRSLNN